MTVIAQIGHLAARAFMRSVRQPGQLFFALAFPLVFLAVIASGLNRASALKGFPTDSFVAFMLANPVGGVALGLAQFSVYFIAGMVVGVDFKAGPLGIPVLFLLAAFIAIAFGAAGMTIALRTGSSDGVQGMFPLFFVLLFLSSMNLPRNLIEADWFRWIATVNPVSYLIEGLRSLVITEIG